jgi:anti-sigma factor RsiW
MLAPYVEASLTPKQMHDVDLHVRSCAACASLLGEVRVVDALLATAMPAELAPNFTFAVMAEVRSRPVPESTRAPLVAILGGYLLGAWVVFSALALLLAGRLPALAAFQRSELQAPAEALRALTGAASSIAPAMPSVLAVVAALAVIDAIFLACVVFFYRDVRPRLAAHIARSEAP